MEQAVDNNFTQTMERQTFKLGAGLIYAWLCLAFLHIPCLAGESLPTDPKATQRSDHPLHQIKMLFQQAESYRTQGHLSEAAKRYRTVQALAEEESLDTYAVLATGLYGYVRFLQQDYAQAESNLSQALQQSIESDWTLQAAIHANHLGIYYGAIGQRSKAREVYSEARILAQKNEDSLLDARIQINQARLETIENPTRAWVILQALDMHLKKVELNAEKTPLLVAAGYQVLQLEGHPKIDRNKHNQLIRTLLNEGLMLAKQFHQPRQQSMALGHLARYEESQGHLQLGLKLTNQAVSILQRTDAKDLLLRWEWQRGRLLAALDRESEALAAYRLSVSHIEAIRGDIPVEYQNGRSSFRETLQPVYLGLADLLIKKADASDSKETVQGLLREARNTVELIKKTELEDYFDNRCTIESLPEVALELIAPKTAALYPILFQDRLELLISLPDGMHHRSVPISASIVTQNAKEFARQLRDFPLQLREFNNQYKPLAEKLYRWLILPIDDLLAQHQIETIIYIPDGSLRLIPLAALSDGSHYVIENYAVVTSPGLKLFDPKPLPRNDMSTLLAGLSRPGPVIGTLPDAFLQLVIDNAKVASPVDRSLPKSRDLGRVFFRGDAVQAKSASSIRGQLSNPKMTNRVKEVLSLPGVAAELERLTDLLPTTTLLNDTYTKDRLQKEIQQSPFRVIHLASHGVFGGTSSDSFIMAYDQILKIDELESLLRSDIHQDNPIELLTLSACQTAEGDDRSPLGISGVAIKAKVRSAVGSLWSVADLATVEFMTIFYQQLKQPDVSKAQALQVAQQSLLKQDQYAHPFFWSPFILIGNWL